MFSLFGVGLFCCGVGVDLRCWVCLVWFSLVVVVLLIWFWCCCVLVAALVGGVVC